MEQKITAAREDHYDFRRRLAVLHSFCLSAEAPPLQEGELLLDDQWGIVPESEDPVLLHGVRDLQDFFRISLGLNLKIGESRKAGNIRVGLASEENRLTSRVIVETGEIRITGATAREAAQGCYHLEQELRLREFPAVKLGMRSWTRMYSPRMVHSGWELEMYPDEYMDQMAHAGMDAILVFITEPPNLTRNGRIDLNYLTEHAAEFGLDVYVYPSFHELAGRYHPLDREAEKYFDDLYGSIIREAPGVKGMILVGESVAFPSRDPGMEGFWWKRGDNPEAHLNGFWPCSDWVDFLQLVSRVTRKYRSDLDLVFWTYNWEHAEEEDRLRLLRNIPQDVTLLVTLEMGDDPVEKCGVPMTADDYSITHPGPGRVFISEAQVAADRGIRLYSMTNTGGMTWDCGVVPYMPVPFQWLKRCRGMLNARRKWGLAGLMESHHYGFTPGLISELNNRYFTEEYCNDREFLRLLEQIAARIFGGENKAAVLAAWKDWSEAFEWHSARFWDQYGPLRVGPVYPMLLPGEKIPEPLHPVYDYLLDGTRTGNGWKYILDSYEVPDGELEGHIRMADRELRLLAAGNEKMERVTAELPVEKMPEARRMLGIGLFLYHTVLTMRHLKCYRKFALQGRKTGWASVQKEMLEILDREAENVQATIPLVEYDSRLGWEPTMLYTTDADCLNWKLQQLQHARHLLNSLAAGISDGPAEK